MWFCSWLWDVKRCGFAAGCGMLRDAVLQLVAEVRGRLVCPIFKGQAVQEKRFLGLLFLGR